MQSSWALFSFVKILKELKQICAAGVEQVHLFGGADKAFLCVTVGWGCSHSVPPCEEVPRSSLGFWTSERCCRWSQASTTESSCREDCCCRQNRPHRTLKHMKTPPQTSSPAVFIHFISLDILDSFNYVNFHFIHKSSISWNEGFNHKFRTEKKPKQTIRTSVCFQSEPDATTGIPVQWDDADVAGDDGMLELVQDDAVCITVPWKCLEGRSSNESSCFPVPNILLNLLSSERDQEKPKTWNYSTDLIIFCSSNSV